MFLNATVLDIKIIDSQLYLTIWAKPSKKAV